MPQGQYLRTNYRRTGGELDVISLGKGIVLGSAGGSGVGGQGGGCKMAPFVMGSYSGNFPGITISTVGSNAIKINAGSALASFYGCDKVGEGSGYGVYPFWVRPKLTQGLAQSGTGNIHWYASLTTSTGCSDFFIYYRLSDTIGFGTESAGQSACFVWAGLVISAP